MVVGHLGGGDAPGHRKDRDSAATSFPQWQNWSEQHFVSLRRALCSVSSSPEPLLDKLSASVAVEADVEPAMVSSLCDTRMLKELGLNVSEQEELLNAVQFALKEKIGHIVEGPPSELALCSNTWAIVKVLCNGVVNIHHNLAAEARRSRVLYDLCAQQVQCERVLCDVQKQLAAERCRQEQQLFCPV